MERLYFVGFIQFRSDTFGVGIRNFLNMQKIKR